MVGRLMPQTPIHVAEVYEVTGFQQLGSTPLPKTLTRYISRELNDKVLLCGLVPTWASLLKVGV